MSSKNEFMAFAPSARAVTILLKDFVLALPTAYTFLTEERQSSPAITNPLSF